MNYVRRTHNGLDYAKVEVYDEHGSVEEYEVNKHLADAINNLHRVAAKYSRIVASKPSK